jgi:two-component system sensor histidine kinase KdpD
MRKLSPWVSKLIPFIAGLVCVAATAAILLALQSWLPIAVVALLFLLPVIVIATWGGLQPALATSLVAFLAFTYFFTDPQHTLLVQNPEELLALLVFLFVTVVISRLVSTANEHAAQARDRELESTTLYNLSKTLGAQVDLDEALSSVTRQVAEVFQLSGCEILLTAADGSQQSRARFPRTDDAPAAQQAGTLTEPLADQVVDLSLTASGAPIGVLRLITRQPAATITPSMSRMLTTFATQLGLVIERAQLASAAERARVLEETDQFKSALLSSVSHDLRTPLAGIKAAATVLLNEELHMDGEARRDMLITINEEADRLNRLVGDLLDMSRIEGGALRLRPDWCDLDELIRGVVDRLAPRLTGLTVRLNWPDDLPLVRADYVQIDRVVTNLLENAMRYAPPGSAIDISVENREDGITFSIDNEGPAIPGELLPHLFGKFQRLMPGSPADVSTGLGLSICKGIVEAHGGRIWAESPLWDNQGARFAFTLPNLRLPARLAEEPSPEIRPNNGQDQTS